MSAVTTRAKAFDGNGRHTGPGRWLNLVRKCNEIADGMFGEPTFERPPGQYVEVYPDALVIMDLDSDGEAETVTVRSTTEHGDSVIRQAAAALEMVVSE